MEEQNSCLFQLQEAKAKLCLFQIICFNISTKQVTHKVRQDTQTLIFILKNKQ